MGAWTKSLLPALPLRATREVTGWFEPVDAAACAAGRLPVFLLESRHGMHYGIPPQGGAGIGAGVKVGLVGHRSPDAGAGFHHRFKPHPLVALDRIRRRRGPTLLVPALLGYADLHVRCISLGPLP